MSETEHHKGIVRELYYLKGFKANEVYDMLKDKFGFTDYCEGDTYLYEDNRFFMMEDELRYFEIVCDKEVDHDPPITITSIDDGNDMHYSGSFYNGSAGLDECILEAIEAYEKEHKRWDE